MRRAKLFTNARFWIGGSERTWCDRILCIDGVITGLSDEQIAAGIETLTPRELEALETIDLGGTFAYPAFRDGHCHPLFAGRELQGAKITACKTIAEIQGALHLYITQNPGTFWVDAAAFDRGLLRELTNPRLILDEVSREHPIVLHADDHHTLWVNSKALELADLLRSVPILSEGEVSVGIDGKPTGVLREWPAMKLVLDQMPKPDLASDFKAWIQAEQELLDFGVVEVQDAWIDPGMTNSYLALAESGRLRIRVNLAFRLDPATWRRDWPGFLTDLKRVRKLNADRLSANAVKIFIDGAFGNQTAALKDPYTDGGFGNINWTEDELDAAIGSATKEGLQLHFHAIGDAAVAFAAEALVRNQHKHPAVIAHAELIDPADYAKLESTGVILQFQPLWARRDSMLKSCAESLGEARVGRLYAISTALSGGLSVAFGSDWPVSDPNPLAGLAVAVSRLNVSNVDEPALNPQEAIELPEAWHAYSAGVADQLQGSTPRGRLEIGHLADFITLPVNVFEVAPLSLSDLKVQSVYMSANPAATT